MNDAELRAEATREVEEAFHALFVEFKELYRRAADAVSPGMLPNLLHVLVTLTSIGPRSNSELANHLGLDKGLMSRQVTELERRGLVVRVADSLDGRVRRIELTDLARERLAIARAPHERAIATAVEPWSSTDIASLARLLQALASSVHEVAKPTENSGANPGDRPANADLHSSS